ncbi:Rad4p, involved in nucleotide excisionRepair [Trichoderma parareesei]|uniref:Rad4p, involved in nucleotide excisionRepair n=1 Tax=Trichoderma parareesei TaxID=858221 RepID=A0A2H2ZQ95_TRIPA|nr:Rad4p, involved in nucleotide excisionRepair [Trichoderma parareesei]
MVGTKRNTPQRGARQQANRGGGGNEPDIYQQMLAEAGVSAPAVSSPERPLKRRRGVASSPSRAVLEKAEPAISSSSSVGEASRSKTEKPGDGDEEAEEDDDEMEFEDVAIPEPTLQTLELDSDDDEEDEDEALQFEDVQFNMPLPDEASQSQRPQELELNLSAQKSAMTSKQGVDRRKPLTKEEKERRIDIHKTHILCLLTHVAKRNHWCNDAQVQESLRPHLTDKMVQYLTPGTNLSQFGRTESLKNGLKLVTDMWKNKFEITERGMRRALWAEKVEDLDSYELPDDMESCLDKSDFRQAAKTLQGSRDVGAQLYCALLRSIGVRARLVCSLQPLSFGSAGPTLPKAKATTTKSKSATKAEHMLSQVAKYREMAAAVSSTSGAGPSTARRRLGHPNATDYRFEPTAAPSRPRPTFASPKKIRESPYPIYWVEILDVGHQKWQPTDPVVTHTFWKPRVFEPPITDKENCLCYVVAFNEDGTAKDVTRRYAKGYTAKTRRLRIETAVDDGKKWWRKVMKMFQPAVVDDLDQIEDIELASVEAREPMPRNVQDFKGHPVYALERHLRRHEVLAPGAVPSGTVSAGARAPLEKVFRRKDVRIARSAEKWFRLGREVKPLEIPAKWLPKRVQRRRFGRDEDDEQESNEGDAGIPIYTSDQTELYEPPPVRNGRVPKNKFGNIEVYVPSMVPKGGVHIASDYARRAAYLLGIDCAPALTGFQFKGRQGTAVLNGVVVAKEYEEAVRAVIQGMVDLEQEMEDDKRRYVALKLWRRFLMGLRIRERIWSGVGEEERKEADRQAELEAELGGAESDETEEFDMVVDDDDEGGGGFLVE